MSSRRSTPAENELGELILAGADDFVGAVFAADIVARSVLAGSAVPPTDPNGARAGRTVLGGGGGVATYRACSEK